MDNSREAARQHVKRLRNFYSHVFAYIVINGFLVAINLITTPDHLWFYWVAIAWGLGLVFDAYDTFFKNRIFGSEWEDRKIEQFVTRHPNAKPVEKEEEQDKERKSA